MLDSWQHEDSLSQSHGLQTCKWQETLGGEIRNILALEVTACKGTFTELARAIGNRMTGWFHTGPYPTRVVFDKTADISDVTSGTVPISLGDCISRMRSLSQLYQAVMSKPSNVYMAQIFYIARQERTSDPQADISLFKTGNIDETDMREIFRLSPDLPIVQRAGTNWVSMPALWARVTGGSEADLIGRMPCFEDDAGEIANIIRPVRGKYDVSPILNLYMLSYTLGMIVRYYPSIWMALLRNEKGDQAQPLLLAAMKVIEDGFLGHTVKFLSS